MVDSVLAEADIDLSAVNALGFTVGPGSFTGIRIGFGVAQGLAFGREIPVIPISTLESMATAANHQLSIPVGSLVLTLLDARMDEIYWAVFKKRGDNSLERVVADTLSSPEDIHSELVIKNSDSPLFGIGDGWKYADRLALKPSTVEPHFYPDAEAVLRLAMNKFKQGMLEKITDVQPLYLRDRITWQKRKRLRAKSVI